MFTRPENYVDVSALSGNVLLLSDYEIVTKYEKDENTGRSVKTDEPKKNQNFPGMTGYAAKVQYQGSVDRQLRQLDGKTVPVPDLGEARVTVWAESCPPGKLGDFVKFSGLLAFGYSGGISFCAQGAELYDPEKDSGTSSNDFNLEVG